MRSCEPVVGSHKREKSIEVTDVVHWIGCEVCGARCEDPPRSFNEEIVFIKPLQGGEGRCWKQGRKHFQDGKSFASFFASFRFLRSAIGSFVLQLLNCFLV